MRKIVIIDYGVGNLKSITNALSFLGFESLISSSSSEILTASHLILPGVGSFGNGIKKLVNLDIPNLLDKYLKKGNSLLGICLGMQMFFEESTENGSHKGLGLIKGSVKEIPKDVIDNKVNRKVPHIGWSEIKNNNSDQSWKESCLKDSPKDKYFYFVHSYMAIPKERSDILAITDYMGVAIAAAVKKDNITGLQFHPEKSGKNGLLVLNNFLKN